ncbi:hypothetical protein MHU86_20456 [Fragilaria crotonensis]|nr:hypothetical protein MHU86_20456 [Fragilaria crotonensis]
MSQVVTADIRASRMIQQQRESQAMGEDTPQAVNSDVLKAFRGKEFLLDSRIWNCGIAQEANVPSAGGRFSAMGLAHFYHDLGRSGKVLDNATIEMVSTPVATETIVGALQGATVMATDDEERRVSLGLGYQLVSFDKSNHGLAMLVSAVRLDCITQTAAFR